MLDLVEELGKRLKLLVSTLAALSRACQWVSQRSLSLSIDRTVRGMLCMSMNMNLSHESWLLFMPCLLAEKEIKTVYCFDALAEGICKVSILGELSAQPDSFLIILRSRSWPAVVAALCSVSVSVQKGTRGFRSLWKQSANMSGLELRFVVQMAWGLLSSQALLAFFYFFISNNTL